jgi:hypothetical protein
MMAAAPPFVNAANAVLELIRSSRGAWHISSEQLLNLRMTLRSDDALLLAFAAWSFRGSARKRFAPRAVM